MSEKTNHLTLRWGCITVSELGVLVTDSSNKIVLPQPSPTHEGGYYNVEGQSPQADELVLKRKDDELLQVNLRKEIFIFNRVVYEW